MSGSEGNCVGVRFCEKLLQGQVLRGSFLGYVRCTGAFEPTPVHSKGQMEAQNAVCSAQGSHIFTLVHHYELNTFRTRSRGNPKTRDS